MGVGRSFAFGREILAGHFLSKLPGSLVGSPGLEGATLAKNSSFFFFFSFQIIERLCLSLFPCSQV